MEKITQMKLRTNKGKIHQTDAREYKAELHEFMKAALEEYDLIITDVDNGFIIEMPHDELGSIPIEAKFVIKPINYDVMSAGEMYQMKLDNAALKEKERVKK